MWDPQLRLCDIEIAVQPELNEKYKVQIDDSIIWNISTKFDFEIQYIDTSIILQTKSNTPNIMSLSKLIDDTFTVTEYIFLDTIGFEIGRHLPNGSWHQIQNSVMNDSIRENNYDHELMPELFVLYQNYPNPFNGRTRISFNLLEDAVLTLYISDATGRIHNKILLKEYMTSGNYNYEWDGENRSSGIYFITLQAENDRTTPVVFSRKMIYMK